MNESTLQLPAHIKAEIDQLEADIRKYRAGKMGEIKFQKIRLQMGVYAQRQPGVQMQRIKIPFGGLTSAKLRRLADVAEKFASGFMHLTTRQDVQLYYIQLEQVPDMMRALAEAGITTREACGNTIRNVTACYRAGTSPTESFDVTPYADAFVQFMLRNPICQNMGRKFKVAFEGCAKDDHAGMRIHDLGFWARVKEVNGKRKRGFETYVGGGLGAQAILGHLWSEFLPEEELIPFAASVVRVFDRYGERKSRMQARMKFLVKKIGFEAFKKHVEAERQALKVGPGWNDFLKTISAQETPPPRPHQVPKVVADLTKDADYIAWREGAVLKHRDAAYAAVQVRIPLGDLDVKRARKLADISEVFSGGSLRITIDQNLMLRWVLPEHLPELYAALREADLAYLGAETFADVTACPGADTCRLGITSAKGLATRLSDGMSNGLGKFKELTKDLRIKISGCPNSCAQHVVANIGFQGAALAKDGKTVPAEMVYVGGMLLGAETRIAEAVMKIPTRNAPKVVERLLELYREEKKGDEHFDLVMRRLGVARLKEELQPLTHIPSFAEDPDFYEDWGHEQEKFEVQKGVKGECAGATVEEKIPTFADADKSLQQAEAFLIHKDWRSAALSAYHAMALSAHVPLYTKLVDPFTDEQTMWEFENLLVRTGEADQRWLDISDRLKDVRSETPDEEHAAEMVELAKAFHADCQRIETTLKSAPAK